MYENCKKNALFFHTEQQLLLRVDSTYNCRNGDVGYALEICGNKPYLTQKLKETKWVRYSDKKLRSSCIEITDEKSKQTVEILYGNAGKVGV